MKILNHINSMKTDAETKEFNEWFSQNWSKSGGLIRPSDAANLIGITPQAISQALKKGKMQLYKHPKNGSFVSLNEVLFKASEKNAKK